MKEDYIIDILSLVGINSWLRTGKFYVGIVSKCTR